MLLAATALAASSGVLSVLTAILCVLLIVCLL